MTQFALEHAVAAALGESHGTVRKRGFGLVKPDPGDAEVDRLTLVLDCPFCGHAIAHPGTTHCGSTAMAECDRCDVYFGFDETEVYVAPDVPTDRAA